MNKRRLEYIKIGCFFLACIIFFSQWIITGNILNLFCSIMFFISSVFNVKDLLSQKSK